MMREKQKLAMRFSGRLLTCGSAEHGERKMRKKKLWLIRTLAAALILSAAVPVCPSLAAEDSEYTESYEDTGEETTEETEYIPESYYWTVESNEISGWPQGPQIEAEAAVVMDADTGAFLYSKNMDRKEYPASITKIMTALVAIESGKLDSKIKFSENAVYNLEEGSSHVGIQVGEVLSMRRALYGLMLESANDVANGIAETVGGSISGFADLMNAKAAELGCVNTHFTNPHGLQNEEHYTCARDMALITQAALKHPTFQKIAGTTNYTCPKTNKVDEERYWYNHNQMIQKDAEYYYEGCFGGKTGFTSDALNTLVSYAKKDGRTLICVELHVNGKDKAYSESHAMLDYAFENFQNVTVAANESTVTRSQLIGMDNLGELSALRTGAMDETLVSGPSEVTVTIPKTAEASAVERKGNGSGGLIYSYNGWQVGNTSLSYNSFSFDVPTPSTVPVNYTEIIEETEPGVKGMVQMAVRKTTAFGKTAGKIIGEFFRTLPEKFTWLKDKILWLIDWINEHDIMAAVVGLILLLILIPILGIAWARNSKAQKIRKQRKKEREERIRIEKSIDSKPVSEIEAELRAEIEKDRLERQQAVEEAREMHVEEEPVSQEEDQK
mgnify:FL=1